MFNFSHILSDLQAAIAVVAARERHLTVLLVAVWGKIARMASRLERLVALWRAGTLPGQREPRQRGPRPDRADQFARAKTIFPTSPAWLITRVQNAVGYGLQLQHLLSDAECAAFLAAVPQAGRILRPLFHMLGVRPTPPALRKPPTQAVYPPPAAPLAAMVEGVPPSSVIFSGA